MADLRKFVSFIFLCFLSDIYGEPTSIGRDFLAGLPGGTEISVVAGFKGANVTITNTDHESVQIIVNGSDTVTVTGDQADVQRVELSASQDVTVYVKSGVSQSLLIPSKTLGTIYYLPRLATGAVVVAGKDTQIKIGEITHRLLANQSYKIDNSNDSKISSTVPISVFMFTNDTGLVLQPSNVWGAKFLITDTTGDEINVMAQDSVVKCKDGDKDLLTLEAGKSVFTAFTKQVQVHCESPVQIIQFNKDSADKMSLATPTVQFSNVHTVDVINGETLEITLKSAPKFTNNVVVEPDAGSVTDKKYGDFSVLRYQPGSGRYTVSNRNPSAQMSVRVFSDASGPKPGSLRLTDTANCVSGQKISEIGDGMDNDCDGWVDEELHNYKDDDGDGAIDEDIAQPNELFPAEIDGWRLSYTVLIIICVIFLLLISIGIFHWQCNKCDPKIELVDDNLMLASYDSRMLNYRYSLSGSTSGFTLSRR